MEVQRGSRPSKPVRCCSPHGRGAARGAPRLDARARAARGPLEGRRHRAARGRVRRRPDRSRPASTSRSCAGATRTSALVVDLPPGTNAEPVAEALRRSRHHRRRPDRGARPVDDAETVRPLAWGWVAGVLAPRDHGHDHHRGVRDERAAPARDARPALGQRRRPTAPAAGALAAGIVVGTARLDRRDGRRARRTGRASGRRSRRSSATTRVRTCIAATRPRGHRRSPASARQRSPRSSRPARSPASRCSRRSAGGARSVRCRVAWCRPGSHCSGRRRAARRSSRPAPGTAHPGAAISSPSPR